MAIDTNPPAQACPIRYVADPLFQLPDALLQIERLKPADWDEGKISSAEEDLHSTPLGQLCRQPLLSRSAERYAFLRMNYEKFAATGSTGAKQDAHLAKARKFRDRIVLGNVRLLVSIASQFASPGLRTEDLVSSGILPLLGAVELFDVSRGWAFGTYATHTLRNHFRRTGQRRQKQNGLSGRLSDARLAELPDARIPPDRQQELAQKHHRLVQRCLAELPWTDQLILRTRFGFDDPASGKLRSYAEVGQVVGLSKERVRVRTHRALELLRETAQKRQWEFPELDSLPLGI